MVQLTDDLGCTGIDWDYEEIWYGDWLHTGTGPYKLDQVIYKQGAILYAI
jgi:hypothetical protein